MKLLFIKLLHIFIIGFTLISCNKKKEAQETEDISAYGHPISQLAPTPNIDHIAQNGAKFYNNFSTNSI